MRTTSAIFIFVFLTASSQGYAINQHDGLDIDKRFPSDVHVEDNDLTDSTMQEEGPKFDTTVTRTKAKYGSSRNLKGIETRLLTTLLDVQLGNLEAIRTIKLEFLKMLAANIQVLIDEIERNDVSSLLNSPVVDIVLEMVLPLLSGNDDDTVGSVTENYYFSDTSNGDDDASLKENTEIPVADENAIGKADSVDIDPLLEESSPTSSVRSSVRKILRS